MSESAPVQTVKQEMPPLMPVAAFDLRASSLAAPLSPAVGTPVHPNAKSTTSTQNGTTTTKSSISQPVCRNCKTQTTPLWRRDETGQVLCNACGLFLKLHGRPRPISLKTDVIKSRNRVKNPSNRSSPNTPELKAKEAPAAKPQSSAARPAAAPGKFSPKQYRPKPKESSPDDATRVHPVHGSPWFAQAHPHFQSQQVPLGYPSSTPAQFAPNLKAITSPLLLASAGPHFQPLHAQHSATNALAHVAAGALENLNGKNTNQTPSSALQAMMEPHTVLPHLAMMGSAPPKLPALVAAASVDTASSVVSSPLFGPQYSLNNLSSFSLNGPVPSLPSLKPMVGRNVTATTIHHHHDEPSSNQLSSILGISPAARPSLAAALRSGSALPPPHSASTDDTVLLRTRISELELVNDLYKSRIAELERSEQQARANAEQLRQQVEELKVPTVLTAPKVWTEFSGPIAGALQDNSPASPAAEVNSPAAVATPEEKIHRLGEAESGQSPKRARVEV
ncbi:hypothetical protein BABINDRAFT_160639 [Babjeviella inositovora NRRL Y-12698]|uniref:GATA-type domain-containing protein n=1 Tax=Babjeviella inositovora NRRL Y-12698 TaxID=984486 RepID=A0A1E3QWA1_9ASCO|nr:uncharacterized protein BABINDRAFT_160639 [Babjeviella inositovora NRRL Y-12698]ODQ81267.1 hypothetical protein BABINDRAFT_160639 [Babjeviella inositovora NRRL Y-12698]